MKKIEVAGAPALTKTVTNNITPREQQAILKSLAAGLVPKTGLNHLVVGHDEIEAMFGEMAQRILLNWVKAAPPKVQDDLLNLGVEQLECFRLHGLLELEIS